MRAGSVIIALALTAAVSHNGFNRDDMALCWEVFARPGVLDPALLIRRPPLLPCLAGRVRG